MAGRLAFAVLFTTIAALAGCTGASDQGDEKPGRGEFIIYSLATGQLSDDRQMFRIRPDGTQKLAMTDPINRSNDEPSFNSDGNTVLFSSSRDFPAPAVSSQRMLYKTSIDATIQTRLTANSPQHCVEHEGHFSPDDKTIAFVLSCDNAAVGLANVPLVHRINADGSGQVRVVSDHPALAAAHKEIFAAFATNGRIVFAVDFLTPPPALTIDLFAMDLDGKNTTRLTDLASEGRTILDRPTMLGASVYFVTASRADFGGAQLEAINADGTGRTVLYRIPPFAMSGGLSIPQDFNFAISPDGHSMTFVRIDSTINKETLMTALVDGSSAKAIDATGPFTMTPVWK